MTKWLFSIVGVVFLGMLFDMIYPNGKSNSFCKGLFGVFTIYVLISPFVNLDFNIDINDSYISQDIVESINISKNEALSIRVEKYLNDIGYSNIIVEIDSDLDNSEYSIEKISIDISNLVLDNNNENINIYEAIKNKVVQEFGVDVEKVEVYG